MVAGVCIFNKGYTTFTWLPMNSNCGRKKLYSFVSLWAGAIAHQSFSWTRQANSLYFSLELDVSSTFQGKLTIASKINTYFQWECLTNSHLSRTCELHPLVGKKWFKQWKMVASLSVWKQKLRKGTVKRKYRAQLQSSSRYGFLWAYLIQNGHHIFWGNPVLALHCPNLFLPSSLFP